MLSPTLPPQFQDFASLLPRALSPSLPGAFQNTARPTTPKQSPLNPKSSTVTNSPSLSPKRKSPDTLKDSPPMKMSRKSPPPSITPPSTKKSVSLDEYKKRKNALNGPTTPTFPKTVPLDQFDSPRQVTLQSNWKTASVSPDAAQTYTQQSQEYLSTEWGSADVDIFRGGRS